MNTWLINLLAFAGTYLLMEFVAWSNHKYIMHGPGWILHKSHHEERKGIFEWNDLYFVFYAAVSMTLVYFGWENLDYRFWMGCGVAAYGLTYFLLHDVFIHGRAKFLKSLRSDYFDAMRRAHRAHHKTTTKHGAVEFGLLLFNRKWKEIIRRNKRMKHQVNVR